MTSSRPTSDQDLDIARVQADISRTQEELKEVRGRLTTLIQERDIILRLSPPGPKLLFFWRLGWVAIPFCTVLFCVATILLVALGVNHQLANHGEPYPPPLWLRIALGAGFVGMVAGIVLNFALYFVTIVRNIADLPTPRLLAKFLSWYSIDESPAPVLERPAPSTTSSSWLWIALLGFAVFFIFSR